MHEYTNTINIKPMIFHYYYHIKEITYRMAFWCIKISHYSAEPYHALSCLWHVEARSSDAEQVFLPTSFLAILEIQFSFDFRNHIIFEHLLIDTVMRLKSLVSNVIMYSTQYYSFLLQLHIRWCQWYQLQHVCM